MDYHLAIPKHNMDFSQVRITQPRLLPNYLVVNHVPAPSKTGKLIYQPAHEIFVLITKVTSEGSGEHVHPRSLARAFAIPTHEVWK